MNTWNAMLIRFYTHVLEKCNYNKYFKSKHVVRPSVGNFVKTPCITFILEKRIQIGHSSKLSHTDDGF